MRRRATGGSALFLMAASLGCQPQTTQVETSPTAVVERSADMERRIAQYTRVRLTTDMSTLTDSEKTMLPLLIEAARVMDKLFWVQAYGDRDVLLSSIRNQDG